MDTTRDITPGTATFSDDGTTGDSAARVATRRRRWAGAIVVLAAAAITTGVLVGSNLASAPDPAGHGRCRSAGGRPLVHSRAARRTVEDLHERHRKNQLRLPGAVDRHDAAGRRRGPGGGR